MLRKLGRFLQLAGLLLVPVGMAGNLADPLRIGVWAMLLITAVGLLTFTAGWCLLQFTGPK